LSNTPRFCGPVGFLARCDLGPSHGADEGNRHGTGRLDWVGPGLYLGFDFRRNFFDHRLDGAGLPF
jgi:hypothetical protein